MAGRKPIPDNLKKLRGTDQPCRLSSSPMVVDRVDAAPPPPRWMSKTGKKIYRDASRELMANGLLQRISLPLFLSYCNLIAVHLDAEQRMGETSRLSPVKDSSGNIRSAQISPWHRISMDALEKAARLASEFGITPAAQSRMIANITQPKSEQQKQVEQYFD